MLFAFCHEGDIICISEFIDISPGNVAMPTGSYLKRVPRTPEGQDCRLETRCHGALFSALVNQREVLKADERPQHNFPGSLPRNIFVHQIYPSLSTHGTLPAVSATVHCYYTQNTDGKTEAGKESSLAQDLNPGFCTMMPQCQGQTQARTLIWAAQPCTVRLMAIYPHG